MLRVTGVLLSLIALQAPSWALAGAGGKRPLAEKGQASTPTEATVKPFTGRPITVNPIAAKEPPILLSAWGLLNCPEYAATLVEHGARVIVATSSEKNISIQNLFPEQSDLFYQRMVSAKHEGEQLVPWMKDLCTFCGTGDTCTAINFKYHRGGSNDRFCRMAAEYFKIPVVEAQDIELEGGNLVYEEQSGKKYVVISEHALKSNPNGKDRIVALFAQQGRQVIWVPPLPEEGTGHVDLFLKFHNGKAFLGEIPAELIAQSSGEMKKLALEANKRLNQTEARLKQFGFSVVRVPQSVPYKAQPLGEDLIIYPTFLNAETVGKGGVSPVYISAEPTVSNNPEIKRRITQQVAKIFEQEGLQLHLVSCPSLELFGGGVSCLTGRCPTEVPTLPRQFDFKKENSHKSK